jgi:16S rRNA (adenine1518-N6/adenine1519-N6)-dimethyltransferase
MTKTVRPKKFLGQHFLTDQSIARAIADTVDACPDLPILEVGPGMGVLTQYLLPKGRPTKVVEIDFESVRYLRETHPELEESIIEDDFLKMHLERTFDGRPFVLTGNYPYNISSQIFFKMLDYRHLIPCCTGMIQKEVAERLAAPPGCKAYGILSVLVRLWYDVEYLFTVEPGVFNPPPKVKSAVIRLTRNASTDCGCDERLLRRVVKTVFNQRRKMMRGSIKPLLAQLDAEAHAAGADHSVFLADALLTRRPEQLDIPDFVALTRAVAQECRVATGADDAEGRFLKNL